MTPLQLAEIHEQAFGSTSAWSESSFVDLLGDPTVMLITNTGGFLLLRVAANEAEILTLAVAPNFQRQGFGRELVTQAIAKASKIANSIFLEVASDNQKAVELYSAFGFETVGRRKNYYRTSASTRTDALIMSRRVTLSAG